MINGNPVSTLRGQPHASLGRGWCAVCQIRANGAAVIKTVPIAHEGLADMTGFFWDDLTKAERDCLDSYFRRRFSVEYHLLENSLDAIDPMDIVYPGNPGEYRRVVYELLVRLHHYGGVFEVHDSDLENSISLVLHEGFDVEEDELERPMSDSARRIVAHIRASERD